MFDQNQRRSSKAKMMADDTMRSNRAQRRSAARASRRKGLCTVEAKPAEYTEGFGQTFANKNLLCISLAALGEACGPIATHFWEEVTAVAIEHFVSAIGWPAPAAVMAKDDAVHVVWCFADLQCALSDWNRKAQELAMLAAIFGLPITRPVSNTAPFDLDAVLEKFAS